MDTPLGLELKRRIAQAGPMGVDAYMAACLYDLEFGYYAKGRNWIQEPGNQDTRTPGNPLDFVTAPELTPVFGRTMARWVARVWEECGRPEPFTLMECGPGRGVLMRDMLGYLQGHYPEVFAAGRAVLVEVSESLMALQRQTLAGFACEWREDTAVAGPVILVANELLDAFPHKQFVDGVERMVGLVGGELAFLGEGAVDEQSPAMEMWLRALPEGVVGACFLDYGAEAEVSGDTLQAVYRHSKVGVFARPGEVDLTCHVNFRRVREVMAKAWPQLEAVPLAGLAEFLLRNGLAEVALADGPQGVEGIGLQRLLHPAQMGTLFKVQVYKRCSIHTRP